MCPCWMLPAQHLGPGTCRTSRRKAWTGKFAMIESLPRHPAGTACSAMLCSDRSALSSACGK